MKEVPNGREKQVQQLRRWRHVRNQILTIFEADGRDYIALLPVDEDEQPNEDGEVFIYRYSEDAEGNPSLENIEDDEEYEVVSDRFDELLDEAEFEDLDD